MELRMFLSRILEKHPRSLLEGFTQTQVSTLAVKDNILVACGFQGELNCKYFNRLGVCFCSRTTYDDNAITNSVEIHTTLRCFTRENIDKVRSCVRNGQIAYQIIYLE